MMGSVALKLHFRGIMGYMSAPDGVQLSCPHTGHKMASSLVSALFREQGVSLDSAVTLIRSVT